MSRTSTIRRVVGIAAVSVLLVACGADGEDDEAAGAGGRSEASDGGLEGEPIKIMASGSFEVPETGTITPEMAGAAQARAHAINEAGGIDGRPIEVIECNVGIDPNLTEQCAQRAVDEEVVAVVGFNASSGDAFFPIVEEAGIAVVGSSPITPASVQSPVSFPLSSGLLGIFAGMPVALEEAEGATDQSFVLTDLGAPTAAGDSFLRWAAERRDTSVRETVSVPPDTTDFGAVAASALRDDVEGVNLLIVGSGTGTLIQNLRAEDPEVPLVTADNFLTDDLIENLGPAADDLLVLSSYRFGPESENGRLLAEDMQAYDPSLDVNDTATDFWLSVWVLEQVLRDIEEPTAATVLEAMGDITDMDMGGMTPPLTTTEEFDDDSTPIPMPRLFNTTVVAYRLQGGARTEVTPGDFTDVFA